jgi:hypothetical protein
LTLNVNGSSEDHVDDFVNLRVLKRLEKLTNL